MTACSYSRNDRGPSGERLCSPRAGALAKRGPARLALAILSTAALTFGGCTSPDAYLRMPGEGTTGSGSSEPTGGAGTTGAAGSSTTGGTGAGGERGTGFAGTEGGATTGAAGRFGRIPTGAAGTGTGGEGGTRAGTAGTRGLGGESGRSGAGGSGRGGSAAGGAAGRSTGGSGGGGGAGGAHVVVAKASAGCTATRTLMNGRITIQSGGTSRSYILRAPDTYDNKHPYPLVLAYHESGADAMAVASGTDAAGSPYYGLWNLANNSMVFVAPEGLNGGWANTGGADVTFTDAILQQVEGNLCIDINHVFATGFAEGGGMGYALACARANVLRAVAVSSASQSSGCDGGTLPIPYFATRGVQEAVTNAATNGRALRDHVAMIDGCSTMTPPEPAVGSGTHICTPYAGCRPGYPVEWCAFDGGHTPAPIDKGQTKTWVPQEAWKFLGQF